MQTRWKVVLVLVANALLGAAILIFAVGFFPHKAVLPGLAEWTHEQSLRTASAPFDRVIFMVVDALRSDFVYGNESHFLFTQNLIRSGAAVPFTGHASPPTITMPRVKAITTGSVPSFIDLVLNFAESDTTSTLASQDSWLAQLRSMPNGKLVMYGDDTWLRLFPDFFARSDGTTSFFVSDFTEVDLNVTRHVPTELNNGDWTAMIMHYLGLDHIGHKTGPQGPNMPTKQKEMDDIVKQIYTAMEQKSHLESSVLVLLGDHGMNEAGNHGANSAGETSTALTFISPKFKTVFVGLGCPQTSVRDFKFYEEVEQSDIAPTLAALLGFPVPKNSLGIIMSKMLQLWKSPKDRFEMIYANAEQIQNIALATFPDSFSPVGLQRCSKTTDLSDEQAIACEWQKILALKNDVRDDPLSADEAIAQMNVFLRKAQSLLSGAASKYDLSKMSAGIGLVSVATAICSAVTFRLIAKSGFVGKVFVLTILLYSITMFASSYVEEEHQFWYWFTAAWLALLATKSRRLDQSAFLSSVLVFLGYGIGRRWNQTGQKYAGAPDLVTEVLTRNPWVLWISILTTYAIISRRLSRNASKWGAKQMSVLPVIVTISAFLFKLAFTSIDAPELLQGISIFDTILVFLNRYSLVKLARIVFLGLGHLFITSLVYEHPWQNQHQKQTFKETFHDILSLFLVTQSRTVNVPLYLIYYLQADFLSRQGFQSLELTLTSLLLQYSSFFVAGGTNAISSVDLSNAYNGISGYNVLAVGVLTFLSNWAGPVWWTSATSCLLSRSLASSQPGANRTRSSLDLFAILTLFACTSTLAVMVACMVLREHLFIWTVFSPKYLYTIAWVFGQHFVINGIFGCQLLGV